MTPLTATRDARRNLKFREPSFQSHFLSPQTFGFSEINVHFLSTTVAVK